MADRLRRLCGALARDMRGLGRPPGFGAFYWVFAAYVVTLTPIFAESDAGSDAESRYQFLSAAIASTAGVTAITFSISILVIQHSASTYSPAILAGLRTDRKFWFTFVFAMIAIGLISFTMLFDLPLVALSLFYFLSTLGLVGMFFLYTISRISPVSVAGGLERSMLMDCRWLRKRARKRSIPSMGDVIKDASCRGRHERLIEAGLALRQMVMSSLKKSDYVTSNRCLGTYVAVLGEYLKIAPYRSWDLDRFLDALFADLDSYGEYGLKNDGLALRDLLPTYEKAGKASVGCIEDAASITHAGSIPLSKCIASLHGLGTASVERGDPILANMAVACIGSIGAHACLSRGSDFGAIGTICLVADASAGRESLRPVPPFSLFMSLSVLAPLIRMSDDAAASERAVSGLSTLAVRGLSPHAGGSAVYSVRLGAARAAIRCVICALGRGEGDGAGPRGAGGRRAGPLVRGLIDLVGGLAAAPGGQYRRSMKEAAIRCLSVIAWILAQDRAGGAEGAHDWEICRAVGLLERSHAVHDEITHDVLTEAAMVALHCCVHWSGAAVCRCLGAISRIAQKGLPPVQAALALALLDLVGGCLAGMGRDAHSERAARIWAHLAARYEGEHGAAPSYDASGLRVSLPKVCSGDLEDMLPEEYAGAYAAPGDLLRRVFPSLDPGKFDRLKRARGSA